MDAVKLRADHMRELIATDAVAYMRPFYKEEHFTLLEQSTFAYALIEAGRVVACAGVAEYWANRGEAWAILHPDCKKDFVKLHNVVKRFLATCPIRRIEASVETGFEAGHRWVKALGFKLETPVARKYLPHGADCSIYARVQ